PCRLSPQDQEVLAVVLAGGLSTRMGRDKAQLRWGRQTLLQRAMERAGALGWPVTVIRQDRVPRRGPLGGIDTAFRGGASVSRAVRLAKTRLARRSPHPQR